MNTTQKKIARKEIYIIKRVTMDVFELQNSHICVKITNYGGKIMDIKLPNGRNFIDVSLGYDSLEKYVTGDKYFGAIIGRFGNRIKDGRYQDPETTKEVHLTVFRLNDSRFFSQLWLSPSA